MLERKLGWAITDGSVMQPYTSKQLQRESSYKATRDDTLWRNGRYKRPASYTEMQRVSERIRYVSSTLS
jgi:hypothetical protein